MNERSSTFKTTRVARRCQTALKSGTSGVLFLGLHVLLATVASNATRGNHGLLFQGSMCHHNRLKLQCTDGSDPLTSTALETATAALHSTAFGWSVAFHTTIPKIKFTCVLSFYAKQTNLSISTTCHTRQSTAIHNNQLSAAISEHRLSLGVYVLQAV